jgi:hypothetical protein
VLSKQEIYQKVRNHLLTQNWRSTDDNDRPLFYGPWGHKCAIGCLIAEEHYQQQIEGTGVCLLFPRSRGHIKRSSEQCLADALIQSGVNVDDESVVNLLVELQDVHDVIPIERWTSELDAIAERHGFALML